MLKTLNFIAKHPLTHKRRIAGFTRFAKWQLQSRLRDEVRVPWIEGSELAVRNGMTGATGNIYCGLHEFSEMGFLLHLLRPEDLFVDVGANIGSYTILASAVVGADSIAAEPDPDTMRFLKRNIEVNEIGDRVATHEAAIGRKPGSARFTIGLDTVNQLIGDENREGRLVEVQTLDNLLAGKNPVLIKLDVEGFEADVVAGAGQTLQKPSLLAIETEGQTADVVGPIMQAGFKKVHYDPYRRSLYPSPQYEESNALFVRNRELVESRLRDAPYRDILGCRV